jgi:hypothetical protein
MTPPGLLKDDYESDYKSEFIASIAGMNPSYISY